MKTLKYLTIADLIALDILFIDLGQLLQGWHADSTAWSRWDQSVYDRMKTEHRKIWLLCQKNGYRQGAT